MKRGYKVQTKSQALIRKAETLLIKSCCCIASAEAIKCGWSFSIVEITAHDKIVIYLRDKEMYKESHYKKRKLYRYRYILTKIYVVDHGQKCETVTLLFIYSKALFQ